MKNKEQKSIAEKMLFEVIPAIMIIGAMLIFILSGILFL